MGEVHMKIDSLDLFLIKNPLIEKFETAYGSDDSIYSVIACMHSGKSEGWSEASPLLAPTYSPESAASVFNTLKDFLAPAIVGHDVSDAHEINRAMSVYKGNPFAKSVIEIAWWALESKLKNLPLHSILGGTYEKIPVGADLGVQDTIDILIEKIDKAVNAGFPRVKLKVKPGWDIDVLKAVCTTFPAQIFHIDCNSGYTLDDLHLFREIDKFGLAMIEQPLFHTDIVDHAKLAKRLETPICLDESINSTFSARQAIELGACRYINLKVGRLGGLQNCIDVNMMSKNAGIGCWIGGMLETSIGAGICAELATIGNITYPSDIFPSDRFYNTELSANRMELAGPGYMLPSMTPGNTYVPDPEILKSRTIKRESYG